MAITTRAAWETDGSPWRAAQPVADLRRTLAGYGMTVYVLGNDSHLNARPPEDHTPFSHTPWPGSQPYPYVLACDIMPHTSINWIELGHQIIADWRAGVHGTGWIKYVNWTDRDGRCWHTARQPNFTQTTSTDRGHIHISGRTDFVASAIAAGYDPVARMRGEDSDMTPEEHSWLQEVHLLLTAGRRLGPAQTSGGGVPIADYSRRFYDVGNAVTALKDATTRIENRLAELGGVDGDAPVGAVTLAQVRDAIRAELDATRLAGA